MMALRKPDLQPSNTLQIKKKGRNTRGLHIAHESETHIHKIVLPMKKFHLKNIL